MSTESAPRTSVFGPSRRSRRNIARSPPSDADRSGAPEVRTEDARPPPTVPSKPVPNKPATGFGTNTAIAVETKSNLLTAEQALVALITVFDRIDSNKTGVVNREAVLSYLDSERRVKALTFEEDFQQETDYNASFEGFFAKLAMLSETLSASAASKITKAEFEVAVQLLAIQCAFDSGVRTTNVRAELQQTLLQNSHIWDPEVVAGLSEAGSTRTNFQQLCEYVSGGLGQHSDNRVLWEEFLALFEQAVLKDLFNLCTPMEGAENEVSRNELKELLLHDSYAQEKLSVVGRFRRQSSWTLNTPEIANALGSIDQVELSWSEFEWHVSMAALSSVWLKYVDPNQTSTGDSELVLKTIQNNDYTVLRQELGSVLWLWQIEDDEPRHVKICRDLVRPDTLWTFEGHDDELQAPVQLSEQLSWESFVDLLSSPYTCEPIADPNDDEPPSIDTISKFLVCQSGGVSLEEEDEEELEGVDWMTECSPEVKRWGEMATEYNTEPSEIAFLQSIAQLSAAHRIEAASPVKLLPAQSRAYQDVSLSPSTLAIEASSPARESAAQESKFKQGQDYSVHLERDKFHADQPFAFTGHNARIPRGKQTLHKESVQDAQQALSAYYQPLPSPSKPSQSCMMDLPTSNQRSNSAKWRLRQQAITASWSERRRLCGSINAKRSVNDAKLTRMGEALTFLSPEHVSTGAIGFGLSQHTPRMPRSTAPDCAVHCYGSHSSPSQPLTPDAQHEIVASHETSRRGKHVGTQGRQPVYSFGHSKRETTPRERQAMGPGAYLPQ